MLSYFLLPFLSSIPKLFLQMQLKCYLFSEIFLSTAGTIHISDFVCTSLKYYCNIFSFSFTYLSLPLNYESLRATSMFNSFENHMYDTVCKNLGPQETFVKNRLLFSKLNSHLRQNLHFAVISQLLQTNLGPQIIFLRILDHCLFSHCQFHQEISPKTENASGAQCHHSH